MVFLTFLVSGTLACSTSSAAEPGHTFKTPTSSKSGEIDGVLIDFGYAWQVQDFETAVTLAERAVELLENSSRDPAIKHAIKHARAIHKLANAQQAVGLLEQSEKNYHTSIQLIEALDGNYASELTRVLGDLGLFYYDRSQYQLASEAFVRVQHILHRAGGVYTLEQLKLIEWLTLINIKTLRPEEADRLQRFSYFISIRNYGEDDPRASSSNRISADGKDVVSLGCQELAMAT